MKTFVVFAALYSVISLSDCLSLLYANEGDNLQKELFDKRTALSFLTRHKRHLAEECSTNEDGCSWEEVEETLSHASAIKNYMIQWHCRSKTCEAGTKCTNKNNDFSHIYRVIVHCADIDECKQNTHGCTHTCHNTHGSYLCLCHDGYQLHPNERTCVDIKECETDKHNCSQECYEMEGSYSCSCNDGYLLLQDNSTCLDIDECVEQNTCGDLQECVNVPGSYQCQCRHGYSKDNRSICTDIDECSTDTVGCSQGCTNSIGSYNCTCNEGFFLDDDQRSCIGMSPVSVDQNSTDNAIMIGSVTGCIGVVVLIVLIVVVIFMLRKRKQPETSSMSYDNNCYANDNENNGYLSVVGDSKPLSFIKNLAASDRPKSENFYNTVE